MTPTTILLVDADATTTTKLPVLLGREGVRCFAVPDVLRALPVLQQRRPAFAVLDEGALGGLPALRAASPATRFLGACEDPACARAFAAAGVRTVLVKPVSVFQVLEATRRRPEPCWHGAGWTERADVSRSDGADA